MMRLEWDDEIELPCEVCGAAMRLTPRELTTSRGKGARACSLQCRLRGRGDSWEAWFWSKVDKTSDPNGCWIWNGSKKYNLADKPYGAVNLGKITPATWVAYYFAYGIAPERNGDLFLCHTCDNSICVNPEHLWIGTAKQNTADSIRKGRR